MALDSRVLSQLRLQLRSNKKCFMGKEFLNKVMEIGQGALAETLDDVDAENHAPSGNVPIANLTVMGQLVEYNEEYACSVAQYLLDEGVLIHVSQVPFLSDGSSLLLTPEQNMDEAEEDGGNQLASSYERKGLTDSVRRLGVNSAVSFASGVSETTSSQSRQSAGNGRRAPSAVSQDRYSSAWSSHTPSTQHYQYRHTHNTTAATTHQPRQPNSDKPIFSAAPGMFYKFAGSEDAEFAFFQSQILMSSEEVSLRNSVSASPVTKESSLLSSSARGENRDFLLARQGTLCLVYDLLSQRARKEKIAKQFLNSPQFQERRWQARTVNCDLIFRM